MKKLTLAITLFASTSSFAYFYDQDERKGSCDGKNPPSYCSSVFSSSLPTLRINDNAELDFNSTKMAMILVNEVFNVQSTKPMVHKFAKKHQLKVENVILSIVHLYSNEIPINEVNILNIVKEN